MASKGKVYKTPAVKMPTKNVKVTTIKYVPSR